MAIYSDYKTIPGLVASSASLATAQFKIVQACSTAGQVKVCTTAATDKILGILQNDPAAGETAEVAYSGICAAAAAASVTFGSKLTTNSTGYVTSTTTDKDEIVGIALAASSTAGDIIPVLLTRFTLSE